MRIAALLLCLAIGLAAAPPWEKKDPRTWSDQEVARILFDSPWAQRANATVAIRSHEAAEPVGPLPGAEQAGLASPGGAGSGRWDGSVGRDPGAGALPSVPLTVRWDSALPIREALARSEKANSDISSEAADHYVITIIGLVPARQYRQGGRLATQSQSEEIDGGGAGARQDPEQMLEGLMSSSRLRLGGHSPIAPEDVKLDAETGNLHILFPRSTNISRADKEIIFSTRFGPFTIQKPFRVKDMQFKGKVEL